MPTDYDGYRMLRYGAILDRVTRRPPLRSATPVPVPVPVPVVPRQRPAPSTPPPGPAPSILAGRSILGGRSILSAPSILAGPAQPPASVLPAGVPRHRRRAGALLVAGGRAMVRWGHRPSGRFVVPLVVIVALLAATGAAGNYAVRATA